MDKTEEADKLECALPVINLLGEFYVLKKLAQILTLAVPMMLVACGGSSSTTTGTTTTTAAATAGYSGSYTGSITGVNAGPATIVVSSSNVVTGSWTITNRDADGGPFPITFKGTVDASGNLKADALWSTGELVMVFSGTINSSGLLTGTYFEPAYPGRPDKAGAFSMSLVGGTSTASTGASTGGCTGSYTGSVEAPPHDVRIANRNRQLTDTGFAITGNDAVDNVNTGGGGVDGGMYLEGNFAWETDANCNVTKGTATLFGHQFSIDGKVNADKSFVLNYFGPIIGSVDANNKISGQLQEGGKTWVYGVLNGKFTPNGKI